MADTFVGVASKGEQLALPLLLAGQLASITELRWCGIGGTMDQGRRWQPYTDFLVYSALMALPWGGPDLAQSAPAELDRLFAKVCCNPALRANTPVIP